LAGTCRDAKEAALGSIETRISTGIERQLAAMNNYVKFILASNAEQRRPEYALADAAVTVAANDQVQTGFCELH
jgi:hypothetical protein